VSEQAVTMTEAMIAVAMRSFAADHLSLRSTEIGYRGRVRLDRADTAFHDRPSPSAEHHIKLTELA